jgi:hypothetical protein
MEIRGEQQMSVGGGEMGGRGVDRVLEKVFNLAGDRMWGRETPDSPSPETFHIGNLAQEIGCRTLAPSDLLAAPSKPRPPRRHLSQPRGWSMATHPHGARIAVELGRAADNHHRLSPAQRLRLLGKPRWPATALDRRRSQVSSKSGPQGLSVQFASPRPTISLSWRLGDGPLSESETETRSGSPICKLIGSHRSRAPPLPSRSDNARRTHAAWVKSRPSPRPNSGRLGHFHRWGSTSFPSYFPVDWVTLT